MKVLEYLHRAILNRPKQAGIARLEKIKKKIEEEKKKKKKRGKK